MKKRIFAVALAAALIGLLAAGCTDTKNSGKTSSAAAGSSTVVTSGEQKGTDAQTASAPTGKSGTASAPAGESEAAPASPAGEQKSLEGAAPSGEKPESGAATTGPTAPVIVPAERGTGTASAGK